MGLASGPHGMHIYEMPFIGGDCVSSGDHYNPQKTEHGGKHDWNRHIGDLGNIFADSDGVANFEFTDLLISLTGGYSIINRTLGVSPVSPTSSKLFNCYYFYTQFKFPSRSLKKPMILVEVPMSKVRRTETLVHQ